MCRSRVQRDGAQHPVPDHQQTRSDAGALRRTPRAAKHRQLTDRARRAHRSTRFRALHREVPRRHRVEVF